MAIPRDFMEPTIHFCFSKKEDCAFRCFCEPDCVWWSHDFEFDHCILTVDCPEVDNDCNTCVSGQSTCDIPGNVVIECGEG